MLSTNRICVCLFLLLGALRCAATEELPAFPTQESACTVELLQDLIPEREKEVGKTATGYQATIHTDIQIVKRNFLLLVFHPMEFHLQFLTILSGVSVAQKAAKDESVGKLLWQLSSRGLASYAFPENYAFISGSYELSFQGAASCQNKACCIYDASPVKQSGGYGGIPRFVGRIWVNLTDHTIVRFKGRLIPASHMNPLLVIYSHFQFDFTRFEVAPGVWLPEQIVSENTGRNRDWIYPEFRAVTRFYDVRRH
jgi:hypothetical protein